MGLLRLKVGGQYVTVAQGPAGPIGPQGPAGDMVASPATLTSNMPTEIPLKLKGASGQTGNLLEFLSNTGSVLAHIKSGGTIETTASVNAATVRAGVDTGVDSSLHVTNADPARRGITVKGAASQTGNLAEFRDSAGTILSTVDKDGKGTGGLAGAMVKLFDSTLTSAVAQVDVTGIVSATYPILMVYVDAPQITSGYAGMRFNGLTTGYDYHYEYTGYAGTYVTNQASALFSHNSSYSGTKNLTATIFTKDSRYETTLWTGVNTTPKWKTMGNQTTSPDITSLSFVYTSDTWPVGTRFLVYGVRV